MTDAPEGDHGAGADLDRGMRISKRSATSDLAGNAVSNLSDGETIDLLGPSTSK